MTMRTRTLAVPLVALCLSTGLLSGCGGDDGDKAGTSSSTDGGASQAPAATPGPAGSLTDPNADDKGAPGAPDARGRQGVVFDRLPGNKTGACEVVGDRRDVKSGGFVGGAFDDARKSYGKVRPGLKPKQVRLYWVPEHAKPMGGVTVVATTAGARVKVVQRTAADAEQWKFYDTLIKLPSAGRWRFKVSSGADHGCFVATF